MRPSMRCLTVVLLCSTAMLADKLCAWDEDGTAVARTSATEYLAQVAADGAGGVIVVWEQTTDSTVRAKRLDAYGNSLWGAGGIVVSDPAGEAGGAVMLGTGDGGCYIVWSGETVSGSVLQVQRFDGNGSAMWTSGPATIREAAGWVTDPVVVAGPSGGLIVAWLETRSGYDEIYGQRVDADGTVRWLMNGRAICSALGDKSHLTGISDGVGGAYFAWADNRSAATDDDVYVQRILPIGAPAWTANGQAVSLATTLDVAPRLALAADGGLFVGWYTLSTTVEVVIRAQRYSLSGTAQWASGGIAVSEAGSIGSSRPFLVPDADDGVILAWSQDGPTRNDVMAQRLAGDGTAQWAPGGNAFTAVDGAIQVRDAVADGHGGVVLSYRSDQLGSTFDLFAQRVDGDGHALWAAGGVPFCAAIGLQETPQMVLSDDGALLVAWDDDRGTSGDVYAQRVELTTGAWGFPEPALDSVADVPADEGGRVMVNWRGGERDVAWLAETTHYSIWRATTAQPAKAGAIVASPAAVGPDFSGEAWLAAKGFYWEWVANQTAARREGYAYAAATVNDSLSTGTNWHRFQVLAHTADPLVFWPSAVDSGYSVDNLAPSVPTALAVRYGDGNRLSWRPVESPDLRGYAVYRGATADFAPGPASLVAVVGGTTWTDAAAGHGVHYAIAALDFAGNTSAVARPSQTSDMPAGPGAGSLVLHPGVPNPFNPRTTLAFDLPRAARVTLVIVDAAGRRVRTLVAPSSLDAGRHLAAWDGRDDAGRGVGAGSYFARLEAGHLAATRQLTLVK